MEKAVKMNDGEPVQNVPRSIKEEGHQILKLIDNEDGTYNLIVKKVVGQTTSVISTISSIIKSAIVCLQNLFFKFFFSYSVYCKFETLAWLCIIRKKLYSSITNSDKLFFVLNKWDYCFALVY